MLEPVITLLEMTKFGQISYFHQMLHDVTFEILQYSVFNQLVITYKYVDFITEQPLLYIDMLT